MKPNNISRFERLNGVGIDSSSYAGKLQMNHSSNKYVKTLFLFLLLLISYYWLIQNIKYAPRINFKSFHSSHNVSQIIKRFLEENVTTTFSSNDTTITSTTTTTMVTIVNRTMITTSTIDPAELIVERPSASSQISSNPSNATLAVFIFHTQHSVLANLQLFLIRKLAMNLIAVELFLDGSASKEMRQVAHLHKAGLHSFPSDMHGKNDGASEKNANVVNWALATHGKDYLRSGTAVLLLDGDILPLTHFDSVTLLNSHDIVCRRHPATFARFCWIGFICLAPQLYSTIDDFNVSPTVRAGKFYDSGGRTIEYLMKYKKTSFSWMKETILLENDKELFWGAIDNDITWIQTHFDRCDKCGPEIFFSAFNTSNAMFYHMISAASEWRFLIPGSRQQELYDSIMRSPYVSNRTNELNTSIQKILKMRLIPFHGNLTCASICHEKSERWN